MNIDTLCHILTIHQKYSHEAHREYVQTQTRNISDNLKMLLMTGTPAAETELMQTEDSKGNNKLHEGINRDLQHKYKRC
jgi:hypothetical protein